MVNKDANGGCWALRTVQNCIVRTKEVIREFINPTQFVCAALFCENVGNSEDMLVATTALAILGERNG